MLLNHIFVTRPAPTTAPSWPMSTLALPADLSPCVILKRGSVLYRLTILSCLIIDEMSTLYYIIWLAYSMGIYRLITAVVHSLVNSSAGGAQVLRPADHERRPGQKPLITLALTLDPCPPGERMLFSDPPPGPGFGLPGGIGSPLSHSHVLLTT